MKQTIKKPKLKDTIAPNKLNQCKVKLQKQTQNVVNFFLSNLYFLTFYILHFSIFSASSGPFFNDLIQYTKSVNVMTSILC